MSIAPKAITALATIERLCIAYAEKEEWAPGEAHWMAVQTAFLLTPEVATLPEVCGYFGVSIHQVMANRARWIASKHVHAVVKKYQAATGTTPPKREV
jgi:hypothetical protein